MTPRHPTPLVSRAFGAREFGHPFNLTLTTGGSYNTVYTQDGFIHIAASGWISVNTEEKKNKHYIQKLKISNIRSCSTRKPNHINVDNMV